MMMTSFVKRLAHLAVVAGCLGLSVPAGLAQTAQPPARIVAIGGAVTETLYRLGQQDRRLGPPRRVVRILLGGEPAQPVVVGERRTEPVPVPQVVADLLRATERAYPGVAIGSYPFFRDGRAGANFVVRSADPALVDACLADLTSGLEQAGFAVMADGI